MNKSTLLPPSSPSLRINPSPLPPSTSLRMNSSPLPPAPSLGMAASPLVMPGSQLPPTSSSFAAVLRDLAKNAGDLEAKARGLQGDPFNSALLDVRKVGLNSY